MLPHGRERLLQAQREEERYDVVNSTKIKAASAAVEYEDFRNMVAAAHLQPVNAKRSMKQGESGGALSAGAAATIGFELASDVRSKQHMQDLNNKLLLESAISLTSPPTNAHDFERDWNRHCTSSESRYEYLCRIEPVTLSKIFSAGLGFEFLGPILTTLAEHVDSLNQAFAAQLLLELSRVPRFALSASFLEAQEKKAAEKLIAALENSSSSKLGEAAADVPTLRKLYGI